MILKSHDIILKYKYCCTGIQIITKIIVAQLFDINILYYMRIITSRHMRVLLIKITAVLTMIVVIIIVKYLIIINIIKIKNITFSIKGRYSFRKLVKKKTIPVIISMIQREYIIIIFQT